MSRAERRIDMMRADFEALYMDIYVGDERAIVERRRHLLRLWEKYKEEEDRRRAEAKFKTLGTELQAWEYEKETDIDRTEAIRKESFGTDLQADGGKQLVCQPPGSLLRSVSEFVFSKKTLEYVIDPIIADMQAEYFEVLAAKRPYEAAWVRLRGSWSFAKAVSLYSVVKAAVEMWRKISRAAGAGVAL